MKVKIQKEFEVAHPVMEVWEHLIKPLEMSECVPGVTLDEKIDERNYKGKVELKFGPVSANYKASVSYENIDKDQKMITLVGKGIDTGGAGSADARLNMRLLELTERSSKIMSDMEITVSGKVAQFGSRLINDVSDELFGQFVSNFKKKLENKEISSGDKNVSIWKIIKLMWKRIFK